MPRQATPKPPAPSRATALAQLRDGKPWDMLIIGGGATGLGCAVDAATRGYRTLLVERGDFACGTSSRSTKLIHGGVRYLRQGELSLVRHALVERARLLANAAPLVHPLPFVIPTHGFAEQAWYGAGLKLYDLLAGAGSLGDSRWLGRAAVLAAQPGLRARGLHGGIQYWDAQFDDARLAIALMRTAVDQGASCLNYVALTGLLKPSPGGHVSGARLRDVENGEEFEVRAKAVINATGVYADAVRRLDETTAPPLLTHSQGVHLVVDGGFLPGAAAVLVPKTADGRVLFAIPWQGKVLIGTTDTARDDLPDDPQPFAAEVDFLLQTAAGVLARAPRRDDVRSAFAGLRPLFDPAHTGSNGGAGTAGLSREHAVMVGDSGLVTVTGGKWTTYRWMAEQVVDRAATVAGLPAVACGTQRLPLHVADAEAQSDLPGNDIPLLPGYPWTEATVRRAIRAEAARTIEDILGRRTRALFLDAAAAAVAIARVGELLAEELALPPARVQVLAQAAQAAARRFQLR